MLGLGLSVRVGVRVRVLWLGFKDLGFMFRGLGLGF
jgi:hypothetical protein